MLRTLYLPTMLLAVGCLTARAMPTSAIPTRSLEAEMAHADEARAVPIHTEFASGEALFFAGTGMVLVARHALLTPSNQFADKITIAVALPPLENMEQLTTTPVAQDPGHDLVLLHVAKNAYARPFGVAAAPAAAATASTVQPCGPPQAEAVGETHRAVTHVRRRRVRHHARHNSREAVQTHVVWDGPVAHWQ